MGFCKWREVGLIAEQLSTNEEGPSSIELIVNEGCNFHYCVDLTSRLVEKLCCD